MFVIDNILISDELVDAPFTRISGASHGACCVPGDSEAPLETDEIPDFKAVFPIAEHRLRPEARKIIRKKRVWEESSPGQFAVTCVGTSESVFATCEGQVAKCAVERAFEDGKTEFRKPISSHLHLLRIEQLGDFERLNNKQMDMRQSGMRCGTRNILQRIDFLEGPWKRKYGQKWMVDLKEFVEYRRSVFSETL